MDKFSAVKSFLKDTKLTVFIDEKHVELSTLSEYSTIEEAMKILSSKHIMSAPVLDEDGEYYGCVSVGDILKGATKGLEESFGQHYFEDSTTVNADQLKEFGEDFTSKAVRAIMHEGDLWLKGDPTTSLLDVILLGFSVQEGRVHHRIFVCDPAKSHHISVNDKTTVVNIEQGSEKVQASGWRPTDVVSQLDILNVLWAHREVLSDVLDESLESMEAFLGSEATIPGDMPALVAFHHMASDHKSTLGITGPGGKLVGTLSVSDVRFLPADGFGLLLRPVAEYVAIVHGIGPTIPDALAGARAQGADEGRWDDVLKGTPLVTVGPSTTFSKLLEAIIINKAHRVHVIDEEGLPLSIITLTDILRLITKDKAAPAQRPHVPAASDDEDEDDDDMQADEVA